MLCRLCLTDFMGDGFSLFTDSETNREARGGTVEPSTFLTIIAKCLHLELTPPDVLCNVCWQHLYEFDKFCKYIELQQTTWYSENLIVKSEVEYIKEELDTYPCPTVTESATDPISNNEEAILTAVETKIEEPVVDRLTDIPAEDNRHANEILEKKTPSKKMRIARNRKKLSTKKVSMKKSKMKRREESPEILRKCNEFIMSNNLFFCDLCQEKFETLSLLRMHFREKHNSIGYIKCCNRVIKTYTSLIDHVKYHLNPMCYECKICHIFYKSECNLKSHILQKHSKELKHNCAVCNKGFATTSSFSKHMLQHAPVKQYACKICNKRVINKYNLALHMRAVHEDVSLICDHCGKRYKNRICFQQHIDKHEGTLADHIQCQKCGDWLKTKKCLDKHMEIHDPIDVECKLCGRQYSSKASYVTHMRQQHDCKPKDIFTCTHCGKVIKHKQKFEEHLTVHTGEKLYTCPYCDNKLRFKANLATHIRKLHPTEQRKFKKKQLSQKRDKSDTT